MRAVSFLLSLALPLTLAVKEQRVLGGQPTLPGQYNATALILISTSPKQTTVCGGALISPTAVLTAAHCVQSLLGANYDPKQFSVGLGLLSSQGFNLTRPYFVKKAIAHPDYSADVVSNDIGVLLLNETVPGNVSTPIKIIAGKYDLDTRVVAAGYGQTSNVKGSLATQLMAVDLRLGNSSHCKNLNQHWLSNSQICTDGTAGKDTCNADSGGPLMATYNDNGDWGLLGITSYGEEGTTSNATGFGNACGTEGGAGFYTYAAYYLDWIAKNAGVNKDDIQVTNTTTVHPNATLMASAEGQSTLLSADESSKAAGRSSSGAATVLGTGNARSVAVVATLLMCFGFAM